MADLFSSSLIKRIQTLLQDPTLRLENSALWGSQQEHHREALHRSLQTHKTDGCFSSISHCLGQGLWALSTQASVGIDIEESPRVTMPVVTRVAQAEELENMPSPADLWCAKEACFKALRAFKQPSVISKISIGDWQKIDSQTDTYRLLNASSFSSPSENRGVSLRINSYTVSIFTFLT
ncbi:MAG: 4'-phosphopantetheinyl transferase superfamily protein [Bdellovibrio sp.]